MCDIWRIREPKELTTNDLRQQLVAFRELGVRWVVFTGGEPQLNSQLFSLAALLRAEGIRVTLLTAGLLLEPQAQAVADAFDELTVSLDGPPVVHDSIRRVPRAFVRLVDGVRAVRRLRPAMPVRARCTVQKANHISLRAAVQSAKQIGLNSISFLAADVSSTAFNHPEGWLPERQTRVVLDAEEVEALDLEMERLIRECACDIASGFVVEAPGKLRRIVLHYRAHLGQAAHVAPRCNAPWVSTVIEASGDVRPCFFHPTIGNIYAQKLPEILNGPVALQFRESLDVETNPVCRKCVCSLHLPRET
jgi:MoaA/NifB/PqqE/SkfB family radical SAM enzyme